MNITDRKNFLLSEIRISAPSRIPTINSWEDMTNWVGLDAFESQELLDNITQNIFNRDELLSFIKSKYNGDIKDKLIRYYSKIDEGLEDEFYVGKETETDTAKTVVTDIDNETQSVTWNVTKGLNDSDIHKELTKLINKLESQKKDYNNPKRLAILLQKLKFIRNTFKRTSDG